MGNRGRRWSRLKSLRARRVLVARNSCPFYGERRGVRRDFPVTIMKPLVGRVRLRVTVIEADAPSINYGRLLIRD